MNAANKRHHRITGLAFLAAAGALGSATPALAAPAASRVPAGRAFVRVELPKRAAYVGESIPVTVRAYFRSDTGVSVGAPTFADASFTLRTSDAAKGSAVIEGVRYRVVTWKDHLSPVRAGQYAVEVDVPSTLEWQDVVARQPSPAGESRGGGMHDDPFDDSFFSGGDPFQQMRRQMEQMMNEAAEDDVGPVQRKEVVLHSPAAALEVLPLPTAGRPPEFTDAVGHFEISASADSTHVRVGEPVALTLRVTGDGNYDRVSVAGLHDSSDFRAYAPSSSEGKGEKSFKQSIVPLRVGVSAIPSASFSYFDPDSARYVTSSSAPIPLEVAPGLGAAAGSSGHIPAATSGPTLAPNAEVLGRSVTSLKPVFLRPWFWGVQAFPLAGLAAALLVVARRRRRAGDPGGARRRQAQRAVRGYRAAMDQALTAGDSTAFFAAARGAIQQSLGALWQIEPAAISLSEVEARLGAEHVEKLRPVFDADAARFSGGGHGATDLAGWKHSIECEIDRIEQMEAA